MYLLIKTKQPYDILLVHEKFSGVIWLSMLVVGRG